MSVELKINDQSIPAGRVFCVGKNYPDHIRELADETPDQPVIFMKPATSLVAPGIPVPFPPHGSVLHHEVEVVVLVGKRGKNIRLEEAHTYIQGVSLGVDLTLRDVQTRLKKKGLPWELSKSFDHSALLGALIPLSNEIDLARLEFSLRVNGDLRQTGNTQDMLHPIPRILEFLSGVWELLPGDLIFTGTPSGVGPVRPGDRLTIQNDSIGEFSWEFI